MKTNIRKEKSSDTSATRECLMESDESGATCHGSASPHFPGRTPPDHGLKNWLKIDRFS
jgi:hypothetical protein